MIVVERGRLPTGLDKEIARLEALARDLKRLASGEFPVSPDLASAPVLEDYLLATRDLPCLTGRVRDHPYLEDGHLVMSSDLWMFAPGFGWARTMSRLYRLGRAGSSSAGSLLSEAWQRRTQG